MVASYLATARKFASRYEENEVNELSPRESSFVSFTSFEEHRIRRAKISALAGHAGSRGDAWRSAITAGIRYANEGLLNPAAIQEDIDVWKELAADHGWPEPPCDLIANEVNEFNEERRST